MFDYSALMLKHYDILLYHIIKSQD